VNRPLPVCPPPYHDEGIDPWVERVAREYHMSRPKFLCAAGLRNRLTQRTFPRDPVRTRELPALAILTRSSLADLRRRSALAPATWTVRAQRDFIFCLCCVGEDYVQHRLPYQRAVWQSAARVACAADRHWLWSARGRFGCGRVDRLFKHREELPLTTWLEHLHEAGRALNRLEEYHPEVSYTVREIQSAIDGALRGAAPPEEQWGAIDATDFLHVVRDVASWAITNFEPFPAHPAAYSIPPQLHLGTFDPFRWPHRRSPAWDHRIGATPLNAVFDPCLRRAALWTAHELLTSHHPRRPPARRALSLHERRQRVFQYQSAEGLAWLVAQAHHWPRRYVQDQWNGFAAVRKKLA